MTFSDSLSLDKMKKNVDFINKIIKFQSIIRGTMYRKKNLPIILLIIQKILQQQNIKLSNITDDGRINSSIDENNIIKIIKEKIPNRISKPQKRMWYDLQVLDYRYGWLPVNIKTTTTFTSDNTGNLTMCVHAYTNEKLDMNKTYQNGKMSKILIDKLNKKEYNLIDKKDYYFIVVNKNNNLQDPSRIIVNSVKGLSELTPNINNLPFQVCWINNKCFNYKKITENVVMLINALQKPKPSWHESFLTNIRKIVI